MSTRDYNIFVNLDGSITLDSNRIQIPNIQVKRQIGRGANAVVFLGENVFLNRQVAVKLWLPSARIHGRRDKFRQGIYEAQKVSSFDDPHIVRVYDAGDASGLFYMSMELYPSVTLKEWLTSRSRSFELRLRLANELYVAIGRTHHEGVFHGDLHGGNVLIHDKYGGEVPDFEAPDFKIIDFGTSHFSGPEFSLARHWRILEKTIDRLLKPLRMRPLWYHLKPSDITDHMAMHGWFQDYFHNLETILEIGYRGRSHREIVIYEKPKDKGANWSSRDVQLTQDGLAFLRNLKETGALSSEDINFISSRSLP